MLTKDELPQQITQTMYVALTPYDNLRFVDVDMTEFGWAMLGEVEVTADVPQVDPVGQRINGLESQRQKVQAKYSKEMDKIDDQIQRLRALTHNPEPEA